MIICLNQLIDLLVGKDLQALAEISLSYGFDSLGELFDRFPDGIHEHDTRYAGNQSPDKDIDTHLLGRFPDLGVGGIFAGSEEFPLIDLNSEESGGEDQEGSKYLDCDENTDS